MSSKGWIGVDLDKTLAEYDDVWRGVEYIGAPIAPMVERVKQWLAEGKDVRIFTARVTVNDERDKAESREAKLAIDRWCLEHIGRALPVTNVKDFSMIQLWDDRAVQVVPNEGREIIDAGVPCPLCKAEAVCCATQGDRSWLHCVKCNADFVQKPAATEKEHEQQPPRMPHWFKECRVKKHTTMLLGVDEFVCATCRKTEFIEGSPFDDQRHYHGHAVRVGHREPREACPACVPTWKCGCGRVNGALVTVCAQCDTLRPRA